MSLSTEDLLARLIGFDTTSRNPNFPCIEFIRDYLSGLGVACEIIAGGKKGKACLFATIGEATDSCPMLAGHTDVVPADGQPWSGDPFRLSEREGKLYGRGAADMKGFIAAALAFIPQFLAAKSGKGFHLALTFDEEGDMTGARRLAAYLMEKKAKPRWIWIGEPTEFKVITQHKGSAVFRTRFTGVSGHSGQPQKGLNAIDMAAAMMNVLLDMGRQRKARPHAGSACDSPYTTVNLGTINGGTADNIIAGECELVWQLRVHHGDCAADFLAEAEARTHDFLAARLASFPAAAMETERGLDIPPFAAAPGNKAARALQMALDTEETQAVNFATEACLYQQLCPDLAVCGPGSIEQAHQVDEFIEKRQLQRCVDLMGKVLLSSFPIYERESI